MNRRDFLTRMAAAGLVAATPKLIFDLGANKHKYVVILDEWVPFEPNLRHPVHWSAENCKHVDAYYRIVGKTCEYTITMGV